MFTLLATAIANDKNKLYPLHEKHSALIFVLADGLELAQKRAIQELDALGWTNVSIGKSKEVTSESFEGKDQTLKDAFNSAQRQGFGVVIYKDPI